jgi:lactaldehyde dehydrogenase/glycolaldehyde dehydrogenase
MSIATTEATIYSDGEWLLASGEPIAVVNPTDERVLAEVPSATPSEVEAVTEAAQLAEGEWSRTPAAIRGRHLREVADLFAAHRDRLAASLVREVGKPAAQAAGEVEFAISILRYTAEWDRRLEGEILPADERGETIHLLRAPVGVVAAICPWNFPLAVWCRKIAPALLTGNTVVAKPSEVTPLTTLEAMRLIDEHLDLPRGVLNVVTGGGATGEALVGAQRVAMVTFTGHRVTGKRIMAQAAADLKRVALELGGKAPAIVWSDADLEVAVPAIVTARHVNCGQVCTSAERVLVHQSRLDEFTERYVQAVEALRIGDPAADSDLGPLVDRAQLDKTRAAVANAIADGAEVVSGGGDPPGPAYERGYWHQPTVLRGVTPDMRIMGEETFGPVTPILGIESLEEATHVANASRYGLSAYIFSRDYATIMRTVNDLQFGEIYINRTNGEAVHAHHSGFKESGIGGEDGKWGVLRYTQIKTAYHHYG